MKKLTLKALACTLCASLALVGGLVLAGCSGTDPEEAIRTDITTNFDALKSQEGALVDELAAQMEGMGLEDYGIEPSEVVTSVLDGFDYTIDGVTVEDDTATATVTVMSKSISPIANPDSDAMYDAIMEAISSGELDVNDDDAVNAWAGEYIMGLLDAIEPSEKTIELTYTNGDDGWELDETSASEVESIFV
ncbi:hypothetical protein [Olsenella sp. An270]|uniref:hypothetical protein n=1 Tax=Olsenella sp. An270 TaxID=1965615 RepID=UPI000B381CC6|nr:hypothetical protein [Olsenella sp. An270]OUO59119.1 hypothetical protein B5F73_06665 [Olsenella sp. An270]